MNTTNANVPIVARRRPLLWAVIVASLVVGFTTGLLTAKSFSLTAREPKQPVEARINPPAADSAPAAFPIVPSPAVEPHPQFFYGTGTGEMATIIPAHKEPTVDAVFQ